jgi:hypothetical protein
MPGDLTGYEAAWQPLERSKSGVVPVSQTEIQYATSSIVIAIQEKAVEVDGDRIVCLEEMDLPADVESITWNPANRVAGYIVQKGDSHGFTDFCRLVPYVERWHVARVVRDAAALRQRNEKEAALAKETKERQDKFDADKARFEPYRAAMQELGDADHELLKALETLLVREGLLAQGFVDRRNQLRAQVRAERPKIMDILRPKGN